MDVETINNIELIRTHLGRIADTLGHLEHKLELLEDRLSDINITLQDIEKNTQPKLPVG